MKQFVIGVALTVSGIFLGMAVGDEHQPYCPTEDSCNVDYHDGAWHITPTIP